MGKAQHKEQRELFFWSRLASAFIDISVIYSLSIILRLIIWRFGFINFDVIFIITFLGYYTISYGFFSGRTVAKSLSGLKVTETGKTSLSFKKVVLREIIIKGICTLLIPLYLIKTLISVWSPAFSVIVYLIILVLSLLFLFVYKRPWWEFFSGTRTIKEVNSLRNPKLSFMLLTGLITVSLFIMTYPFIVEKKNLKNTFYPGYPVTAETTIYADFIKKHSQDPVDYVFDLFNKNDIVVLSERLHPEYTQYDFIAKIVSDERFIQDVGNIFTECGSISFQDTLNNYLNTSFRTDDELNKSTAILQRNSNSVWPLWNNTNLFDFFKKVNTINSHLPDSTKINWYFTDMPVDWQTMTHEKQVKAYTNPLRDSIMAYNIIEQYRNTIKKQKRHKCLVIMNSRHGYGTIDKIDPAFSAKYKGTTAFLMQELPQQVANIMINTVSIKLGFITTPVQDGKWETAFSQVNNQEAGFNFAGSPFGNDKFDAAFLSTPGVTYKDVFTGFVFYKPLKQHITRNGFPFEFDNFQDTILKRASYVNNSLVENFKRQIELHNQDPENPVTTDPTGYFVLYNLVAIILPAILMLVSLLTGLYYFIRRLTQKI